MYRVELCAELFYAIVPTLIPCSLLIRYPYILLHFSVSVCHFSSSRCFSWSLPFITEQQACPHRLAQELYAVYWLRNHYPRICSNTKSTMDDKNSPISMHTDHISNSAILSNNYVSLSSLCACVQVKKMALQMKP